MQIIALMQQWLSASKHKTSAWARARAQWYGSLLQLPQSRFVMHIQSPLGFIDSLIAIIHDRFCLLELAHTDIASPRERQYQRKGYPASQHDRYLHACCGKPLHISVAGGWVGGANAALYRDVLTLQICLEFNQDYTGESS